MNICAFVLTKLLAVTQYPRFQRSYHHNDILRTQWSQCFIQAAGFLLALHHLTPLRMVHCQQVFQKPHPRCSFLNVKPLAVTNNKTGLWIIMVMSFLD